MTDSDTEENGRRVIVLREGMRAPDIKVNPMAKKGQVLTGPGAVAARNAPALLDRKAMVLRLGRDGMFWNVNRVINSVYIAKSFRRDFAVHWHNSLYFEENSKYGNTWRTYFRQPFPNCKRGQNPEIFKSVFSKKTIRRNQITRSRLSEEHDIQGLGLPMDKEAANAIIREHIVLQPDVRVMVDQFVADNLEGPIVGLHIRGLGRGAGATFELRHFLGDHEAIPFQTYFNEVDKALEKFPGARVFACSDSSDAIETCRQRYGDRLVTYGAIRTSFGEMHSLLGQEDHQHISPHQLGLDIIIEAYALSSCDYLVHGNSNVSNFVLCNSPDMPHHYIFADAQKAYVEWAAKNAGNPEAFKELEQANERLKESLPGTRQRKNEND